MLENRVMRFMLLSWLIKQRIQNKDINGYKYEGGVNEGFIRKQR